jgi:NitT/TauT family transport system permease protein
MSAADGPAKAPAASAADFAPPAEGESEQFRAYLRRLRRERWSVRVAQALLLVVFLILWEIAPDEHWVNPMLTSQPSAVWATLVDMLHEGNLLYHTWVTLLETVVGFAVGMGLGILVAGALWWWNFLYRVLDPFLVIGNALPKIALVPIFYIWLGDTWSIYGIAIAIGVFITILMVYSGFREVDPDKIKLVNTFGALKWQALYTVVLPASVPTMIAALKINVGLALVGVIVGEFQSSKAGLGYLIIYGSQILQMHLVMGSIAILAVISVVMYALIALLEEAVVGKRR